MKVIFEIDTENIDDREYLKIINGKSKIFIAADNFANLYKQIYNRKFYSADDYFVQKIFETSDPLEKPKEKEWVSIDFLEREMENIFKNLKDFQYDI